MFSGIVEEKARVARVEHKGRASRLTIASTLDHSSTAIGDSVAIEGVCLTVVIKEGALLSFDVSAETLRRSTLGTLSAGSAVNLERSLPFNGRIHGHLVAGHIDGVVSLLGKRPESEESYRMEWDLLPSLRGLIAEKGSVALAGVSLTVGEVSETSFTTYLIPHTWGATTLSDLAVGGKVNIEADLLARYVQACLSRAPSSDESVMRTLRDSGFFVGQGFFVGERK